VKRRALLAGFGGIAAALALNARAQKAATPVIGFLSSASPDLYAERLHAFRQGLRDAGYVEGQNVEIEYRWAVGENDRLPSLAANLVHHNVAMIVSAGGVPSALAAKAATATIPIVFAVAVDPVQTGLVAALNRPGGNLTGVVSSNVETGPKRLELLHQVLPKASSFALLVDPTNPTVADALSGVVQKAASTLGLQVHVLRASAERDFDSAFATLAQLRPSGLIIGPFVFFVSQSEELAALTIRHAMPAVAQNRRFVAAGGLLSYGTSEEEYYGLLGTYTGRVLKGEKPSDLPVQQTRTVELLINQKTARVLRLKIPPSILSRADEVIQ